MMEERRVETVIRKELEGKAERGEGRGKVKGGMDGLAGRVAVPCSMDGTSLSPRAWHQSAPHVRLTANSANSRWFHVILNG
jgi:hypothetical protein